MYNGRHGDIKLNIGLSCISFLIGLWIEDLLITERTDAYVATFWCLNVILSVVGIICIAMHLRTRQKIDHLYSTLKEEAENVNPN